VPVGLVPMSARIHSMAMAHERPTKLEVYRSQSVARDYDQRWAGAIGAKRDARKARALQKALQCIETHAGEKALSLLDIPCGTGRFSQLWSDRNLHVIGADLALPMLAEAQAKYPQSTYLAADLAKLPFADNSVDVAICVRFLHLVRDPDLRVAFLKELNRVSRLGAIIDYRHGRTLRVWGRHLRYRLGLRAGAPANPSPRQIRQELDSAGWKRLDWIHVHRAPLLSDKVLIPAVTAEFGLPKT
jgi:SAM-dependent methyltransferase